MAIAGHRLSASARSSRDHGGWPPLSGRDRAARSSDVGEQLARLLRGDPGSPSRSPADAGRHSPLQGFRRGRVGHAAGLHAGHQPVFGDGHQGGIEHAALGGRCGNSPDSRNHRYSVKLTLPISSAHRSLPRTAMVSALDVESAELRCSGDRSSFLAGPLTEIFAIRFLAKGYRERHASDVNATTPDHAARSSSNARRAAALAASRSRPRGCAAAWLGAGS